MRITLLLLAFCFGLECSFADEPKKPVEGLSKLEKEAQELLKLQEQIQTETKKVKEAIDKNADKKPTLKEKDAIEKIAKLQADSISSTKKMIKALDQEKTAVAFSEVMQGLLKDMLTVEKKLGDADLGVVTQEIQSDLVKGLKEVVRALRAPK